MEHTMHTSQQILKTIVQRRGLAYLREDHGKFFVNAFAEMGGDKQDVTLLRYLTKCGAHEDLLEAASLTPAMQRTYYSQAVQKLCDKTLISEELSHRVCGIFWQAVYSKEPPVSQPRIKKLHFLPSSDCSDHQKEDPEKLYQQGMEYRNAGRLEEYLHCLRQAANAGHKNAARRLGFIYECGIDVPKDDVQCAYWCQKAAELGDDASQFTLAGCYAHGKGVPQDYEKAAYWYRKAAAQGVGFAPHGLALVEEKLKRRKNAHD